MAVVIKNRLLLRILMIQSPRGACLQQEIFVDKLHKARMLAVLASNVLQKICDFGEPELTRIAAPARPVHAEENLSAIFQNLSGGIVTASAHHASARMSRSAAQVQALYRSTIIGITRQWSHEP